MAKKQNELFERRQKRTRYKLKKNNHGRVRLTVFRSQRHIYAQVIDDVKGVTLASASSLDAETKAALPKKDSGADTASAAAVGKAIAKRGICRAPDACAPGGWSASRAGCRPSSLKTLTKRDRLWA